MSIEVRQISIRTQVGLPEKNDTPELSEQQLRRLKEEILAECRHMVMEMLRADKER